MDLKIELRKLSALHSASNRLNHGVRAGDEDSWTIFPPSHFIYAYFLFNSIFSFDWETSFSDKKAVQWQPDINGRIPSEISQFKAYAKFADTFIPGNTICLFSRILNESLDMLGVKYTESMLGNISIVNSNNKLRSLAASMPGEFKKLLHGKGSSEEFYPSACVLLEFVYMVRCNLFHGRKTLITLHSELQQSRLLIYTSILIAANSLLFSVADSADIGWKKTSADFQTQNTD